MSSKTREVLARTIAEGMQPRGDAPLQSEPGERPIVYVSNQWVTEDRVYESPLGTLFIRTSDLERMWDYMTRLEASLEEAGGKTGL